MDENDKNDLPKVSSDRDTRKIIIWLWLWLWLICILIAFTVVVGGYFHRNLGRLLGLVFLIPFGIFLFRRSLSPLLIRKLLFGFSLGAFQGILGWLMVTSGLSGRTDVSHYRLAAHLILAFFICSYFLKIIQFMAIAPQPKFNLLFLVSKF